jgi:hypothetical protein
MPGSNLGLNGNMTMMIDGLLLGAQVI